MSKKRLFLPVTLHCPFRFSRLFFFMALGWYFFALSPGAGKDLKAGGEVQVLRVVAGQSRIEEIPGITQVAIGDARIADVKVLDKRNELMISGIREGMTTLRVWQGEKKTDYLIRVLRTDPRILADDLREIVEEIPGVEVRIVGERVMVTGRVLNAMDYQKVQAISRLYPDVLLFVEPNPVSLDPMIRLRVMLIEIDRRSAIELGFSPPGALGAQAALNLTGKAVPGLGPFSGSVVLTSQLEAALHFLYSKGKARSLANPVLVTKNGYLASFHAGGQIPVPVQAGVGQVAIDWKSFGIELKFLPYVDLNSNFNIALTAEVSDLDLGNAVKTSVGTVPAVKSRITSSVVNLAQGESLLIAELLDRREGKVVGGIPGLSQIPLIGELFRARTLNTQESEIYLIVTPSVLRPGSLPREEAPEREQRYRTSEEEVGPQWSE